MANAPWPASVPGPEVGSWTYTPQDNRIRTQMDAGTAKVRRRFTQVGEDATMDLYLTHAQFQTLEDFYEITLGAVLPFDWVDFRKPIEVANVAAYRFKRKPTTRPWGGLHLQVSLELDLLTTYQGTFLLDVDPLTT